MRPVVQISALLIVTGIALFFALGAMLFQSHNYELLALSVVGTSAMVLFGGLQCWLVPRPKPSRKNSVELGFEVCGVVSLFAYSLISIFLLALVFFKLDMNSTYRVSYTHADAPSANLKASALQSGVQYSITHSDFKSGRCSLIVRVDAGRLDQLDRDHPNLAHLSEQACLQRSSAHPDRQGVLTALQSLGVRVDSYTSHRGTFFMLDDLSATPSSIKDALTLLREMVLNQRLNASDVPMQLSVLAGEERLFNSTAAMLRRRVYCHHFGQTHSTCQRLPFMPNLSGASPDPEAVTEQVGRFLSQWYHASRVQLYLAGDFDVRAVSETVQEVWSSPGARTPLDSEVTVPSTHSPIEPPAADHADPDARLLVEAVPGVDGLDFNLLVSTPYAQEKTANFHRWKTLNRVFFGAILNQYMARMMEFDYPRDELHRIVHLAATVQDRFELARSLHSLRLRIGGHPERGEWRRYLEVFFIELRRLAEHGPSRDTLEQLVHTAKQVLHAHRSFSSYEDSAELTRRMLGNRDPSFTFLDWDQLYAINAVFLNRGFLRSASLYLQGEAQFLWRGLVQSVNHSFPFDRAPYHQLRDAVHSLAIFTDVPQKSSVAVANGVIGGESFVRPRDLLSLVSKVLDAQLSPAPRVAPVIRLEDVFFAPEADDSLDHNGFSPLAITTDISTAIADVDAEGDSVLVDLLSTASVSGAAAPGSARTLLGETSVNIDGVRTPEVRLSDASSAVDGLPSSGSLVNSARLIFDTITPSNTSLLQQARGLGDVHLSEAELRKRASEYELLDTYGESGVKRYRLSNGLRVNLKQRLSGSTSLPSDAPGLVQLEVVSLGGRSVLPPVLKGACELVELNVPSGFAVEYWADSDPNNGTPEKGSEIEEVFFDVRTVDSYMARAGRGRPRLRCAHEHLLIRKRLRPKCINFPAVRSCDRRRANYLKKLEAVRVAMSPVFDAISVEKAAKSFDRLLASAESQADPAEFVKWRARWRLQAPWLGASQSLPGPNGTAPSPDPRWTEVTVTDVAELDPIKVGQWVREQFTVDRMEVNVVGDFDEHHLLHQLNHVLGTMPLRRTRRPNATEAASYLNPSSAGAVYSSPPPLPGLSLLSPRAPVRIGYDIYSEAHKPYFALNLSPRAAALPVMPVVYAMNCSLLGMQQGRAHVTMNILLYADRLSMRGSQTAMLHNVVFQQTLLDTLRWETGLVYTLQFQPFASALYDRFGYYQLQWVVPSLADGDGSPWEAVVRSVDAVRAILSRGALDAATFARSKKALISELDASLQESSAWLSILRGLSLFPPTWQQVSLTTPAAAFTLKDMAETDVKGGLDRVTLADVNSFFANLVSRLEPARVAVVESVSFAAPTGNLKLAECAWRRKA